MNCMTLIKLFAVKSCLKQIISFWRARSCLEYCEVSVSSRDEIWTSRSRLGLGCLGLGLGLGLEGLWEHPCHDYTVFLHHVEAGPPISPKRCLHPCPFTFLVLKYRAFSVVGPQTWNNSARVYSPFKNFQTFKTNLKTDLFALIENCRWDHVFSAFQAIKCN